MIYFFNDEHEKNYEALMKLYRLQPGVDVQYEANIYIAALPQIFKCFNEKGINTGFGPLSALLDDKLCAAGGHDTAGLTGSTSQLVEAGMSLYNGHQIGLNDVFGSVASDDLFRVFIQACKIRARKNNIVL